LETYDKYKSAWNDMILLKKEKTQEGQILLIVVLTMIVALTVGLSIAARIVTELKLSKQNEQSQRAFQAAESGIQQTLLRQHNISQGEFEENKASFSTTYLSEVRTAITLNNGLEVDQDAGADVWLSDYSTDPSKIYLNPMGSGAAVPITLYWGNQNQTLCGPDAGDATAPAIEVVILTKDTLGNFEIQKSIYEASCIGAKRVSNPTAVGTAPASQPSSFDQKFAYSAPLTFNGLPLKNGLVMKIIPIFNSSIIGFSSSGPTFPSQGSVVESTGTSGDTVRKVVYYQSFPQLPLEVFPYSLISQ
jgi:hypothetical protein